MPRRVFVVDDHPIVCRGYAALIDREADLEFCGMAESVSEALERIPTCGAEVVIVDISLGGRNGLELIKELQAQHPEIRALVVSVHDEILYAERALAAGAMGYVMKGEADTVIINAIRRVINGYVYLSDRMSTKMLLDRSRRHGTPPDSPLTLLSDRELEVFEMIGRGFSTARISEALLLSPKTVETHRSRIKEKMGLKSGRELVRQAVMWYEASSDR
jgi:DNA-binding NarL/FixJ family response regulator